MQPRKRKMLIRDQVSGKLSSAKVDATIEQEDAAKFGVDLKKVSHIIYYLEKTVANF